MRCGFQGLAAKVQTALEENPLGGKLSMLLDGIDWRQSVPVPHYR
jgi:hypothetical protein